MLSDQILVILRTKYLTHEEKISTDNEIKRKRIFRAGLDLFDIVRVEYLKRPRSRVLCGKIFSLLGTNFTMNVVLVRRVRFKVSPEIQTSISFGLNARKSRLKSCYNDRVILERESYIETTRIAI